VAPARRLAIEDATMRHGRKSKTQRVDGSTRRAARDLDRPLVRAVALPPANVPAAPATEALAADPARQQVTLGAVHLDRAGPSSTLGRARPPDLAGFCKAWPVRATGDRSAKTAVTPDGDRRTIRCPNQVVPPVVPGGTGRFPAATCAVCPLQDRCTTSAHGRSGTIQPDDHLLAELRARPLTPAGRARLRERVQVEHSLAHIGQRPGDRARSRGDRKHRFDLRRVAVVENLHVIARAPAPPRDLRLRQLTT
jgi:transposase